MTFESVRHYGVSLFASAGVAGIVAGLAARPLLTNLIAGVQVEGTIAEAQAQLSATEAQSQNSTRVTTPPGTTATTLSTSNFAFVDAIAERWAMSALGRP